eukprot:CAMPEP_0173302284 /NCGR_PEP_ID=MMETSP1143-20121109/18271_1 /TAXON_ID=483371 /ORGANISM="non described non described, Strain CCMP2298" /LENGTH=161 /DNA_ID=CAMNT_0014242911 /DNA_START=253 /DNA_END=736 /DNA_ORIENTATION=+
MGCAMCAKGECYAVISLLLLHLSTFGSTADAYPSDTSSCGVLPASIRLLTSSLSVSSNAPSRLISKIRGSAVIIPVVTTHQPMCRAFMYDHCAPNIPYEKAVWEELEIQLNHLFSAGPSMISLALDKLLRGGLESDIPRLGHSCSAVDWRVISLALDIVAP